ncbi:MAG: AAA family ATPase, partial [Burkholderiales bacterium]
MVNSSESITRKGLAANAALAATVNAGEPLFTDAAAAQRVLVRVLMNPAAYPHPVKEVRVLETRISYVLLTGVFAYKIKKAVNPGFLDFTRLTQRRFFCDEELRLNRRLAPDIYLAVVPISGTSTDLRIEGEGQTVEYAIRMREFSQSALFDRLLSEDGLSFGQIDALADRVADFHLHAMRATAADAYGSPTGVWQPVSQNFEQLRALLPANAGDGTERPLLDALESWSSDEYLRLRRLLSTRKHDGFVRECHGDVHSGNIAWSGGEPQIFDCVEFNANLRWIDVMSEVAFLVMDLEERGKPAHAHRFLNRYLEITGDYAGLQLLPFYKVYRALARAKVACQRAAQEKPAAARKQAAICARYLACAARISLPQPRWLLLTHGFSGAGKNTVSQRIVEHTGALRLRSDVERKRLCGLPPLGDSESTVDGGLYDGETTRATDQCLVQLTRQVLEAGFPVIVDAVSLK